MTQEETPSEERANELAKCFEDDKNGHIPHPSERIVESVKQIPVKPEPKKPEPVKMTSAKPVQSPVTPLKSVGTVPPMRQVVPKKPVAPVSAMSYQQRRQMYNTSRPGHSLPNPLLSMKPRPVTTKPAVVVGSNRLASTRPGVSTLHPVASGSSDSTVRSAKLEHPSVTRQPASIHPTPLHPTTVTHTTTPVHPTPVVHASVSKASSTPPVTRLARNASSLPNYMRDTAASRAKQVSTPISAPSQRSNPVSSFLGRHFLGFWN